MIARIGSFRPQAARGWLVLMVVIVTATAARAQGAGLVENFLYPTSDPATQSRRWVSYSPPSANLWSPLVVFLHGGGGNANAVSGWQPSRNGNQYPFLTEDGDPRGWNRRAYDYGFHVVYPDGADDANGLDDGSSGRDGQWNDGRSGACNGQSFAIARNVDDVGFISTIIKRVIAGTKINRVFIAGMSSGGMMTLRIADERNGTKMTGVPLIAIGTDAACLPVQLSPGFPCSGGVSGIFIFGHEDPRMPYDGGDLAGCGRVVSAATTVEKFHGALATHRAWTRDPDPDHVSRMDVSQWTNRDGTVAKMETVHGMGHQYPPHMSALDKLGLNGPMTKEFNATNDIWDFFLAR